MLRAALSSTCANAAPVNRVNHVCARSFFFLFLFLFFYFFPSSKIYRFSSRVCLVLLVCLSVCKRASECVIRASGVLRSCIITGDDGERDLFLRDRL